MLHHSSSICWQQNLTTTSDTQVQELTITNQRKPIKNIGGIHHHMTLVNARKAPATGPALNVSKQMRSRRAACIRGTYPAPNNASILQLSCSKTLSILTNNRYIYMCTCTLACSRCPSGLELHRCIHASDGLPLSPLPPPQLLLLLPL